MLVGAPTAGRLRHVAGVLAAVCLGLSGAPATAVEAPHAVVAVPAATGAQWNGPQYVGADGKGRVFLLQAEGLLVYPVERDGTLGEPEALETAGMDTPAPVLDAAMGGHGDWVLLAGSDPRWFHAGEEVVLPPLHWAATSVALVDGRPVIATHPLPKGRVAQRELASPPLLLSPSKDDWSVLAESDLEGPPDVKKAMQIQQRSFARLLADSDGSLWLANQYRYRLAHYTSGGRELLTLEVDGAKVRHRDDDDPALEKAREDLAREHARYSEPEKARVEVNTAVLTVFDLTEGPDGRIYLLVRGDGERGSFHLDRYDGVEGKMERVPLRADVAGAISIAAGKSGLYLVPFNGTKARYRVPWEALETADWQPLEGVMMDGLELPVRPVE